MFIGIVFIALGLLLVLNALGIIVSSNFWGLFWAIFFLVIGFRMLMKKGKCPMCGFGALHGKIHQKMNNCNCECEHEHSENN